MTQPQRKKMMIKRRQAILKKRAMHNAIFNGIMIVLIMSVGLYITVRANQSMQPKVNESKTSIEEVESVETYPEFEYSKDWDANDDYLLAKIAMAEAEGCNIETKIKVIQTVLNRVHDDRFPDTIHDVLYQKVGKVWQFSPVGDGRWNRVEPNEDCWLALQIVKEAKYDESLGALYFESCADPDNWHSRNLEFLYELDGTRFYK